MDILVDQVVSNLVSLVFEIQACIRQAKTNDETKDQLLERAATLGTVLRDIQVKHNYEFQGLREALLGVHKQLSSAKEGLRDLKERKWLSRMFHSMDIKDDLAKVNGDLSAAIQSLQLALSVLSHKKTEEIWQLLKALVKEQPERGEEISPAVNLGMGAVGQGEVLAGMQGHGTNLENIHLWLRPPSPGEASPEEANALARCRDLSTTSIKTESDFEELSWSGREAKAWLRYNRGTMSFLEAQMQHVQSISLMDFFPHIVAVAQMSQPGQSKDWASTHQTLTHALLLGDTLIRRHSRAFNLQKFYTAAEAQHGVETICAALKAFVEGWSLQGVKVEDRVPLAVVNDDRAALHSALGYILYDEPFDFGETPPAVRREWGAAQQQHRDRLTRFRIVPDEELEMGDCISGSVYKAKWMNTDVAVKRVVENTAARPNYEGFARFYAEAATQAAMASPAVVPLYAATPSGKLVMELGQAGLMAWFDKHRSGGLSLKLDLLRQAAQGLTEVHTCKFIHRDVSSCAFVVFHPSRVKIAGFASATRANITGVVTVRKVGRAVWAAPEIFDEKPHTFRSDIYSFGVVMHELLAEQLPFGSGTNNKAVLESKRRGQPPCVLPGGLPPTLAGLAARCCSLRPQDRPASMRDVCDALAKVAVGKGG